VGSICFLRQFWGNFLVPCWGALNLTTTRLLGGKEGSGYILDTIASASRMHSSIRFDYRPWQHFPLCCVLRAILSRFDAYVKAQGRSPRARRARPLGLSFAQYGYVGAANQEFSLLRSFTRGNGVLADLRIGVIFWRFMASLQRMKHTFEGRPS